MKRVYKKASARPAEGGWGVALDGRPMRTPARHELIVPSAALAEAIAAEWDAQQDEVRPATMPLTRLAATAIDRTRTQRDLVVAETANSAGTDPGIRTRTLPAKATSIAGSAADLGSSAVVPAASGAAISTGANPFATARNSLRQR